MPARSTRITALGRQYLDRHPGINRTWATPLQAPSRPREWGLSAAAPIPPLHIVNSAICPPCGSGNVLHVFGRLHVCRACRAQFEVTPAQSGA